MAIKVIGNLVPQEAYIQPGEDVDFAFTVVNDFPIEVKCTAIRLKFTLPTGVTMTDGAPEGYVEVGELTGGFPSDVKSLDTLVKKPKGSYTEKSITLHTLPTCLPGEHEIQIHPQYNFILMELTEAQTKTISVNVDKKQTVS